jgi:hypothetical protein
MMTFRRERHHTYAVHARAKIESTATPAAAIAMPWLRPVTNPTTITKINAKPAACTPYRPFPVANAVIWADMDDEDATNRRDADPSLTFIPNVSRFPRPGLLLFADRGAYPGTVCAWSRFGT